jgi:hypothetical protein
MESGETDLGVVIGVSLLAGPRSRAYTLVLRGTRGSRDNLLRYLLDGRFPLYEVSSK